MNVLLWMKWEAMACSCSCGENQKIIIQKCNTMCNTCQLAFVISYHSDHNVESSCHISYFLNYLHTNGKLLEKLSKKNSTKGGGIVGFLEVFVWIKRKSIGNCYSEMLNSKLIFYSKLLLHNYLESHTNNKIFIQESQALLPSFLLDKILNWREFLF